MHADISPVEAAYRAAERPSGGPAILYEGTSISYPDLVDRAGRLAAVFVDAGVTAGRQVAYLGLNSPTLLVTYLACAWLGATFVPVNSRLTPEETAEVLRHCRAHTLVVEPGHRTAADALPPEEASPHRLLVDDDPAAPVTESPCGAWTPLSQALAGARLPACEPVALAGDDLAILLYTSGTTGRAKGVRITHGNIWANSANVDAALDTRDDDVNLVVTPLFHIGGLNCFTLRSLSRGGTTVVRRSFDPDRTLRDLVGFRVNTLFAVPSMYAALSRAAGFADADLSALHSPVVAGAPVPRHLVLDFAARGVLLQQAWGMTETACFASYLPARLTVAKAGSAGFPMPSTALRITDPGTGRPVDGPGIPGEVCVRGANVSPGYWEDPEATAAATDAEGWFRTGDIGCLDEDGCLTVVDRLKDLIIQNGENIYPAEVERALADCPGLSDVAVVGLPHDARGETVVAVAVPEAGAAPTLEALRDFAATRLARYKLPVALHLTARIPRSPAGKIDRRALRESLLRRDREAPDRENRDAPGEHTRPGGPLPTGGGLVALVESATTAAMGFRPAGVDRGATFADMGMDSMTAVVFRDRLAAATGTDVPATLAFDHPTPAAVVAYLRRLLHGGTDPAVSAPAAAAADDPVVITGMGVRLPGGVRSPGELWDLLERGGDAISAFPVDRGWDLDALCHPDPEAPGTSCTRHGGFLRDAALFDAEFFGISPREALAMDPQQRLLLEVSWEALERAGIDPTSLTGRDIGVFTGLFASGYAELVPSGPDTDGYRVTGSAGSVAAGRVAYVLGTEGPAVAVDTACSSSLVALHLAVRSLRAGECAAALVGGATVMATPDGFVEFSRQRGLAPDGRCKPFAESADGTAWAEGVGVLVLERLSDARRHGREVLAVVRGSAINQDGASNGLTAPNGPSQQRVIRRALTDAGLSAADVDAVEGHGTGTALGDPIEAQALLATYGRARHEPLLLGSVKSNIGHTQAAAGVVGVIKTVLAMRHGVLPRTLHLDRPSSKVDWSSGAVEPLGQARAWPEVGRPRRAAVSSFGLSGTNAHVILEQATPQDTPPTGEEPDLGAAVPLVVSGRSPRSRSDRAGQLAGLLGDEAAPADLAAALATGPTHWDHRAVVLATGSAPARAGLRALAEGRPHEGLITGEAPGGRPPGTTVFVFPGQGAHWAGVGRELWRTDQAFATRMAECERALAPHTDWSLSEVIHGAKGAPSWERVDVGQPVSFAVMVSLAALWQSCGVRPDAVLGHSQGEIAAACVAGALTLPDAARAVALRSKAIAVGLAGRGGMLSVPLPEHEVRACLRGRGDRVEVAAVNGPETTVVGGDPGVLTELHARWEARGIEARIIPVDYASHTSYVEAIKEDLLRLLDGIASTPPAVPWFSTVDGDWVTGPVDSRYWFRNLRRPVRFQPAVLELAAQDFGVFIEIGAHPVLAAAMRATLSQTGPTALVCGTLSRGEGGRARFARSLAEVFVRGGSVDWTRLAPATSHRVELPTYPFRRRRFWPAAALPAGAGPALGHPLLGTVVETPGTGGCVLTGRLSPAAQPWLADHAVNGTVLLPGTALVEMAVRAGDQVGTPVVEELALHDPLWLAADAEVQVGVGGPGADKHREVTIHSRSRHGTSGWVLHAAGRLRAATGPAPAAVAPAWPPPGAAPVATDALYDGLAARGHASGPAFQGLTAGWIRGDERFGEAVLDTMADSCGFALHPALFDAVLHTAMLTADTAGPVGPAAPSADDGPPVPFVWRDVVLHTSGATAVRVRVAPAPGGLSVELTDSVGAPVLSVGSVAMRPLSAQSAAPPENDGMYRVDWPDLPAPAVPADAGGPLTTVLDAGEAAMALGTTARLLLPTGNSPDGGPEQARVRAALTRVLDVVQACVAHPGGGLLVVATHHGVATRNGEPLDPSAAAVWGLVRAAQAEHPGRFVLADLDVPPDSGPDACIQAVAPVLDRVVAAAEPQFALRGGAVRVPRLTPVGAPPPYADAVPAMSHPARALDPAGTALITGGTGMLGQLVARHLVTAHSVRSLVLASRQGPDAPGAAEHCAELRALGARVEVVACDVAEQDGVRALLARIPQDAPLTAVVHAAGVLDDGVISALDARRIDTVLRPKADAAMWLDELTRDLDPAAFVLFSSATGVLGTPGQGNYAAANAVLDALAVRRQAAGRSAVSLAWGFWEGAGKLTRHLTRTDRARLDRIGVHPLSPEQGLRLLDDGLASDRATLVPIAVNRSALRGQASSARFPAILRHLAGPARPAAGTSTRSTPASPSGTADLSALTDLVRQEASAVLSLAAGELIGAADTFEQAGFDSLTALELGERLTALTGIALAATLVFDHPTPAAVAEHLKSLMEPSPATGHDALEAALRDATPDEATCRLIAERLRDLIARKNRAAGGTDAAALADGLASASDEELFDFIDAQF